MAGVLLLVLLLCSGSWAQSSSTRSECSLSEEHKADVAFLLDGFNHISADDFSAVRDFLRTVVPMVGPVAPDLVRVALVKSGENPETEFDLNAFHDLSSVVEAVSRMSQSPPPPGGDSWGFSRRAVDFTLENVFRMDPENRENVPDILILVTDRNSSGVDTDLLNHFSHYMKVFVVGVKVEFSSQSENLYRKVRRTDRAEVFPVEDYQRISNISKELTQSLCRWLKEKLGRGPALRITDVQPRRARASWDNPQVSVFRLELRADDAHGVLQTINVLEHKRRAEIYHLRPNTNYRIRVSAEEVIGGWSFLETVRLTTPPDSVRLRGGPSRCSGSLEMMDRSWSAVCGTDFGLTEAAVVCGELDCGAVSEIHQGVPSTAVNRSFHCEGAETSLKECESSETDCSTAANVSCTDDVLRFGYGFSCAGHLELRHWDGWGHVVTSVEPDLEFGSVLCEQMGCGSAIAVRNLTVSMGSFWRLEPECVKQRSGLSDCLDRDQGLDWDETNYGLHLICIEAFPVLRASVSSEFLSVSWRQRLLLKLGENFTVSCSLDEPFLPGQLRLLSPTGNYTLPPVSHSAHFLFQAFGPAHIGNYTCLYCLVAEFSDCTRSTTLYISPGAPDSLLLIRAAIFVLVLLLWTSAMWLYYKGCGRQKKAVSGARRRRPSAENNAVQMVVL